MKSAVGVLLAAVLSVPIFAADTKQDVDARLKAATEDLHELMNAGDKSIPQSLLDKASCVVVIPSLKKGGFIVGAEYGKGFFTCRKPSGVGWSAPGAITVAGGKFGLLIGGAETDVVMLVMNKNGMEHLLSDHFELGGAASAAAGPMGRDASAMTDAEMHAEMLTYSRQRGIFGGLDLTGAVVKEDDDANRALYGAAISNKQIVQGKEHIPAAAEPFIHALDRASSRK
jgi:lipid-binding SYLF domain-containing protein